jgi:hypothetical protein
MPHWSTDKDYGHEDDAAVTEEDAWEGDERYIFEVQIDANGNLWDGDGNLIQVSREVGGDVNVTRRSPPAGIVPVDPKPLNSQTWSFNRGPVSGTGIDEGIPDFGGGSFGSGMDQESILSLLSDAKDFFKDVSWGDFFGKVLSIAPTIYGLYQTHTQASIAEKAAEGNLELAQALSKKWTDDYNLSEPFKKSLYSALQSRIGAEAPPTLLPGKVPYVNPYRNKINIERGEEGTVSPEYGPGSTLRDAVRSSFFDRNPDAPLSHYIGQHPGAQGIRPDAFTPTGEPPPSEPPPSEPPPFGQETRLDSQDEAWHRYNRGALDFEDLPAHRFQAERGIPPDQYRVRPVVDGVYEPHPTLGGTANEWWARTKHEPHPTLEGTANNQGATTGWWARAKEMAEEARRRRGNTGVEV